MTRGVLRVVAIVGSLAWLGVTTPARAQTASTAPTAEQIEEARKHYDAGLQLTRDEAYDAALAEFDRAYQLAPNFRILYNIGGLKRQLNDFVGAQRALERYLAEGGTQIPQQRVLETQNDIAMLRDRVGHVRVSVDVDGAEISVDDIVVGRSPLAEALLVNPGRRKITATKAGWFPSNVVVVVVGRETTGADLKMSPADTAASPQPAPAPAAPALAPVAARDDVAAPAGDFKVPAIVGWSATAGLAIGAAVTGVMALSASDSLKSERTSANPSRQTLDDDQQKTKTFALVSDVLSVTAIVAAGVSVYLTVRALDGGARAADVAVSPRSMVFRQSW